MDLAADYHRLLKLGDLTTPMAVRTAATMGLADLVHDGCATVEALAAGAGAHPRPLRKLLDHLVAVGVFLAVEDGSRHYGLTPMGELLLSRNEHLGARPALDHQHMLGRADMTMTHLPDVVRTGGPSYQSCHGRSLWDDLNRHRSDVGGLPALGEAGPGMAGDLVVEGYDWSQVDHVVDVGGGTGAVLAALLTAHPHLRGTLVDLPVFAELAERRFAADGLRERSVVVGGSFFDDLPPGADRYLLSAILADWDDEDAVRILRTCAAAAGARGRILVAEVHLTGTDLDPADPTAGALRLEAAMHDPDRRADDIVMLAAAAGLAPGRRTEHRYRSLVELMQSTARADSPATPA